MTASASESNSPSPGGTRRRGEVLRKAILDAALEELRTVGYARLSMDSVAAAAGTGKAALYRRWANRDELVADALRSALPDPAEIELTGDPRTDLLALVTCVRDAIRLSYGEVFRAVRGEATAAQGMVHSLFGDRVMTPCHELTLQVLREGVAAGQLRAEAVNDRVATVGPAMVIHAVITGRPRLSDRYLAAVVDDVILPLVSR
ncbi:TetR family transcriptional regulator [Streptomyces sp. 3MP-14]|uniref:TetR family transcriptional regulator n=1 Tax=Streptomyces mimosae TaxID=2586635 RepID=A0A5N6AN45_9ACTN|nr:MULTISPECIES: TetR/AcrR family transcriptional regulator [Streptomyces]KAB8169635.1 TetR family transcriptional regulator [Streptomyces mimosae]KAB8178383.1 TetR family transcriptional regulator [Streptomyces sp. 3MP-14]